MKKKKKAKSKKVAVTKKAAQKKLAKKKPAPKEEIGEEEGCREKDSSEKDGSEKACNPGQKPKRADSAIRNCRKSREVWRTVRRFGGPVRPCVGRFRERGRIARGRQCVRS